MERASSTEAEVRTFRLRGEPCTKYKSATCRTLCTEFSLGGTGHTIMIGDTLRNSFERSGSTKSPRSCGLPQTTMCPVIGGGAVRKKSSYVRGSAAKWYWSCKYVQCEKRSTALNRTLAERLPDVAATTRDCESAVSSGVSCEPVVGSHPQRRLLGAVRPAARCRRRTRMGVRHGCERVVPRDHVSARHQQSSEGQVYLPAESLSLTSHRSLLRENRLCCCCGNSLGSSAARCCTG